MTPPAEFSREYIAANSKHDDRLYAAFVNSGEPFKSTMKHNFHMGARQGLGVAPEDAAGFANTPSPGLDLTDEQLYYNTKKAKEYWKGVDLPKPTKDLNKLRDDLKRWGYCLIQDGMSKEQVERARKRVIAQADGERLAGVACFNGSPPPPNQAIPNTQLVHCLIAKGEQFVQILEQDPAGCQAAPVIEQLISETIGPDFLISSFISIIAGKHNIPQNMHQDQACSPHQTDYPLTCNTMYLLDPFSAENGGTLVIPGSHLIASKGVSINEPLPPAINLEAPAGTVVVFEGRVLHGTGVNTTDQRRVMIVTNSLKPFMRQQEVSKICVGSPNVASLLVSKRLSNFLSPGPPPLNPARHPAQSLPETPLPSRLPPDNRTGRRRRQLARRIPTFPASRTGIGQLCPDP